MQESEQLSQTLIKVLTRALGCQIIDATYQTKQLHGGTLGDVQLVSGLAETAGGEMLPFEVVHKSQKKWERPGDPDSWRREYDLYALGLDRYFSESFRWPRCYDQTFSEDEIELWLEYIDGISGQALDFDMYRTAALELGRFQGRLFSRMPETFLNFTNLSRLDFVKIKYLRYRSWPEVYDFIRTGDCGIPDHLRAMLIELDEQFETIWERISQLPVVFCHRDFWVENIFFQNGKIRLIDWDTAGFGYLGEDLASFIADESDISKLLQYYKICLPAYYKGFSEFAKAPRFEEACIRELILLMFGYRLVEWFKFSKSPEEKILQIETLQKIYETDPHMIL